VTIGAILFCRGKVRNNRQGKQNKTGKIRNIKPLLSTSSSQKGLRFYEKRGYGDRFVVVQQLKLTGQFNFRRSIQNSVLK